MSEAEFDQFANEYYEINKKGIALTGENPEYFDEYKIRDLAMIVESRGLHPKAGLDFGSGIGASIPHFRRYFPDMQLHCADVSTKSLESAKTRYPGSEIYLQIGEENIPVADNSQDLVFTACVFHHIPHEQHVHWLREIRRILRPGGVFMICEHNPLNPVVVHVVKNSPLDVNAHLIRSSVMRGRLLEAGWKNIDIKYHQFFPRSLSALRRLNKNLAWLPLGAQYHLTAQPSEDSKPSS